MFNVNNACKSRFKQTAFYDQKYFWNWFDCSEKEQQSKEKNIRHVT